MKVVITSHGPEHERKKWAGFPSYVLRIAEYLSCTWANRIISISELNAERLRRKYKREVAVIPNGVVMPEGQNRDSPQKAGTVPVLQHYALEKGEYVLAVGRFVPEKGFHDLIEAFHATQGQSPKSGDSPFRWKLVIAGKADHEDKYSRELKELAGKSKDIILTGFITGKPLQELYSHAGLFVLPSYYEGLPIALLEAMSYGLSCIVSDIPANREVGLAQERYFKPGDISVLSEKIREFVAKPMTEEQKSRQIDLLKQKYNWDNIAEETLKVYQKLK